MKNLFLLIPFLSSLSINQIPAQGGYPDPDEIRVLDSKSISKCVNYLFTKNELCHSKDKYIKYECWLNSKGNIIRISRADSNNVNISLSKEKELSKMLKQKVVFHMPKYLMSKKMEPFRKSFIFIPTKSNCK